MRMLIKKVILNWVIIENDWMNQVAGLSELGALFALNNYGANFSLITSDIFYQYCEDYKKKFLAAKNSGKEGPVLYRFDFDDYLSRSDPRYSADFLMFDKLSGIVLINTIIWTILHEIGHHALWHAQSFKYLSYSEKRQREYDADNWAFKKMTELGYSLFGVDSYMTARGMTEIWYR